MAFNCQDKQGKPCGSEDSACSPPKTLQGQMSSQIPVEVQSNSKDLFLKA